MIETHDGICTGRNGTFNIKGVEVSRFSNMIRIDGVSKKKGLVLNAGISMDVCAAKELANKLLQLCN